MEGKPDYMTVPAAIRELEKIEMIRWSNGHYRLDHAVTKKQKVILSSLGMGAESIHDRQIAGTTKAKQEQEAKQVMEAFRKSGKSLQELMIFLDV